MGELRNQFGTIIVDECHHIPAKTFRHVVSELNPRYLYGLTATPKRKHNDEPLIYAHIGDIVAGIKALPAYARPIQDTPAVTEIFIRETSLAVPFKFSTDNFQLLSKIICFDTTRNQLIIKDIQEQVAQGKKVLLLSERRDHLELIQYIGRLRGHNNHNVIIDYRDSQIPFLERQFKRRQRVYKKLLKMGRTGAWQQ